MKNRAPHCHSILCILPPYILKSVANSGRQHPAEAAARTLSSDASFRVARTFTTVTAAPAPPESAGFRAAALDLQAQRTIYHGRNAQALPGDVIRTEGSGPIGDTAVDEAHDGLGATFDFYAKIFQRNSIDNNGQPLKATVHYGVNYDNAFWNGQQMVFGDGDGQVFNRFTIAVDIIGHELTHGVTQSQVHLAPFYQPGALNESISDVFGSMIKQHRLQQEASEADWLIGEGLFTSNVAGVALRSMKDPGSAYDDPVLGKDPQPKHMRDFVYTLTDQAGVHINCSIPNHAFYLLATSLGGFAWERAGVIWYETLKDTRFGHHTLFADFARLTFSNAVRLYGSKSQESLAVQEAWHQVGINVE
ncbi:MAG TPA: M4 family metallopeptidase [Pyrinomonadaceae bacterium]